MGICDASPFWVVNKVKPPKVNNELQCQAHPNSREMLKQPHDDPAFSQELSTVVTCFMPGRLASISGGNRERKQAPAAPIHLLCVACSHWLRVKQMQ